MNFPESQPLERQPSSLYDPVSWSRLVGAQMQVWAREVLDILQYWIASEVDYLAGND